MNRPIPIAIRHALAYMLIALQILAMIAILCLPLGSCRVYKRDQPYAKKNYRPLP